MKSTHPAAPDNKRNIKTGNKEQKQTSKQQC